MLFFCGRCYSTIVFSLLYFLVVAVVLVNVYVVFLLLLVDHIAINILVLILFILLSDNLEVQYIFITYKEKTI